MGVVGLRENHAALQKKEQPALESRPESFQVLRAALVDAQKDHELRTSGLGGNDADPKKGRYREEKPHGMRAYAMPETPCQKYPHQLT